MKNILFSPGRKAHQRKTMDLINTGIRASQEPLAKKLAEKLLTFSFTYDRESDILNCFFHFGNLT